MIVSRAFANIAVQPLQGVFFGAIILQFDAYHQEKKKNPSTMALEKAAELTAKEKSQMQGAQILRSEAYVEVRRSDER
jgi:hypothetical protein